MGHEIDSSNYWARLEDYPFPFLYTIICFFYIKYKKTNIKKIFYKNKYQHDKTE